MKRKLGLEKERKKKGKEHVWEFDMERNER